MSKSGIVILVALVTLLAVVSFYELKIMRLASHFQQSLINPSSESTLTSSQQSPKHPSHLYVFGGFDGQSGARSSASRLNTTSGKWESIRDMPTPRGDFCGAVVDDKVYMFGGSGYFPAHWNANSEFHILNDTVVYDSSSDTYEALRPMPVERRACGAAVLNDSIYVAGGTNNYWSGALSSVLRYEIKTDQWSTVSSMYYHRRRCQLVALNGRLYAMGHKDHSSSDDESKTVEVYNPANDFWSKLGHTKSYFEGIFGTTVHKGRIYTLNKSNLDVYSPYSNQWSTLEVFGNISAQTLSSMNDKLWAVADDPGSVETRLGIYHPNWKKLDKVYSYDPMTRELKMEPNIKNLLSHKSVFVVKN